LLVACEPPAYIACELYIPRRTRRERERKVSFVTVVQCRRRRRRRKSSFIVLEIYCEIQTAAQVIKQKTDHHQIGAAAAPVLRVDGKHGAFRIELVFLLFLSFF
jgi:hypothetical protein